MTATTLQLSPNQRLKALQNTFPIEFLKIMDNSFLGFDEIFDAIQSRSTTHNSLASFDYPPTDIIEHSDSEWTIRIAATGRAKDTIQVVKDKNELIVSGDKIKEDFKGSFKRQGISMKAFKRIYTLGEFVEIENVSMNDGLLSIKLKKDIPESQKPKTFSIN